MRAAPVSIEGASIRSVQSFFKGALRPVEQLQAIFGYRNAHIFSERVFMPGIGKLLDESGRFIGTDLEKRLEKQAVGFVSFAEALRGKKLH